MRRNVKIVQELDRILDLDKISESFVSDVRSRIISGTSILNSVVPSQLDQIVANITPQIERDFARSLADRDSARD